MAIGGPVARFVLRVLAWLPVAFVVWYFAAPLLVWPAKLVIELVAKVGFADIIRAVEQNGVVFTFATSLKPGQAGIATGTIALDVNGLLYSFGLPLYAALVLAAREAHWPRNLLIGYVVIVPFIAWGVLADFLKTVAIAAGPLVASQTGFSAWQREAIAFAYQFGSLILPTVVPAIVWVVTHRRMFERLRAAN